MVVPPPRPGLVVHFSYLWRHERDQGEETGRKDRPALILAAGVKDGVPRAYLLPITHAEPAAGRGIPIPATVKEHLGLDAAPSWIIVDDINVTRWPGFDLRPRPDAPGRFDYGEIPARLFEQVKAAVRGLRPAPKPTPR
ncbi:growth inhibitor PemK [Rhodocista pekingensis]|uniref:Growth inhibitor PemK n=1 Tax=Rhodocista pekingensis TaxID=201185 RepID=A0ABW2KTG1_9PROT